MSASYLVDLGNTTTMLPSVTNNTFTSGVTAFTSGLQTPLSGLVVGQSVDMIHANTFCNLVVAGVPVVTSGQLRVGVQCSDSDTSGTYTDPTSGLAQLPTSFVSGGFIILNSGSQASGGLFGVGVSGQFIQSGFIAAAGFQRPQRFVRAIVLSGDFFIGNFTASFVSQTKTTGSGGGYSILPSSGSVNV